MNVRTAAVTLAAVLLSGMLGAPLVAEGAAVHEAPVAKAGYAPPQGGHFNNPIGSAAAQRNIEDKVVAAIKHAHAGSDIFITLFSFDRIRVADALIAAHRRGVHVQILMNNHQVTRAMRRTQNELGHNRGNESFIYSCKEGCRSRNEFLHSKMYLFSHTGSAQNVVMTGSDNMTTNALIHQWNDLLIKNDVPEVFDVFHGVFLEMKKDEVAHPQYEKFDIGTRYQLQVMPHPGTDASNDPIMDILRKVSCKGATGGTGVNGRTMIRVSMHRWSGDRGAYLAHKIVNLYAAGCDVRVMHGSADHKTGVQLTRRTKRGRVPIRANGFDESGDGVIDRYSHHKYMVISGHFGDDTAEDRIYTGSSNWASRGMTGDELIFMARGAGYVRQWTRNFNFLWTHGSRAITYGRVAAGGTEPRIGGSAWEND
jgi:phosphatidylserine/phosphatidylglycerophosphate/cardiolipin synthase-like enzyme